MPDYRNSGAKPSSKKSKAKLLSRLAKAPRTTPAAQLARDRASEGGNVHKNSQQQTVAAQPSRTGGTPSQKQGAAKASSGMISKDGGGSTSKNGARKTDVVRSVLLCASYLM